MTVEYIVDFLKSHGLQVDLYFTKTGRLIDRFDLVYYEDELRFYKVSKIEIYEFFAIVYAE